MKIGKLILALGLAAGAWAQTPPPKQPPAPQSASKPSAAAQPNGKAKPADIPAKAAAQSSDGRHGTKLPAAQQSSSSKAAGKGVRDPFVSPIVEKMRTGANCTGSGRQCLFVDDISLQGVVRYPGGYIAVVTSADHTYFLHANDPLANGDVERITKDAITLRQRSTDILGRPVVHEVTRKLGVPAA